MIFKRFHFTEKNLKFVFVNRKYLKKSSFSKNKKFSKRSFLTYIPALVISFLLHDNLIHKLWVDLINDRCSHLDVFCKKLVLRNFAKFTAKHLCQSFFINKVEGFRPAILLKKRLWRRCFPVNFAKFLRRSFLPEQMTA